MFNPNHPFSPWQTNHPRVQDQYQPQTPIIIDSDSDEERPRPQSGMAAYSSMSFHRTEHLGNSYKVADVYSFLPGRHHGFGHDPGPGPGPGSGSGPRQSLSPAYTPLPVEQEKRIRSRLREERHAALCVLMDRELLTVQALAAQEVSVIQFEFTL